MAITPMLPSPFLQPLPRDYPWSKPILPNGQITPQKKNNGSGCSLKYGIDTWFAANSAPSVTVQSSKPVPFQCDTAPHATLSFKAIRSEVHMAQITNTRRHQQQQGCLEWRVV